MFINKKNKNIYINEDFYNNIFYFALVWVSLCLFEIVKGSLDCKLKLFMRKKVKNHFAIKLYKRYKP